MSSPQRGSFFELIYLFINYNTITNYMLIIYEQSNFDHVLAVVSQIRVSGGNRTHDRNFFKHVPFIYVLVL